MLSFENGQTNLVQHPIKPIKKELSPLKQPRVFHCAECDKKFDNEQKLILHSVCHSRLSTKPSYKPVQVIESAPLSSKRRSAKGSPKKSAASSRSSSTDKKAAEPVISFQRFDTAGKKRFMCELCSTCFEKRDLLDRHVLARHVTLSYQCFVCKSYLAKDKYMHHMTHQHGAETSDPEFVKTKLNMNCSALYRCPFCIFTSKDKDRCCEHIQAEHYEEFERNNTPDLDISSPDSLENLMLPETADQLSDEDDLLVEMEPKKTKIRKASTGQRKKRPNNDPSFKFRCVKCTRKFSTSNRLKLHVCTRNIQTFQPQPTAILKTATPATPQVNGFFQCASCRQVFTDKSMFTKHQEEVHMNPPVHGFYHTN